jgi:hypothetical protein
MEKIKKWYFKLQFKIKENQLTWSSVIPQSVEVRMQIKADWFRQGTQLLIQKIIFKQEEKMIILTHSEMQQREKEIKQII